MAATQLQRRRDTAANAAVFLGAAGEVVVDTTNNRMIVHDGATVGGFPAAKLADVGGGTAWTAYTPAVGAGSGTFTSVSATGRYKVIGKTCFFNIEVDITTNGTAAGWLTAVLPFVAGVATQSISGRNTAVGSAVNCSIYAAAGLITIYTTGGAYPGANGSAIVVSGAYEIA